MDLHDRLRRNLDRIRAEIATAAARRRSSDAVRLVAATKSVGWPEIAALVALGQTDLAENRPEQLIARAVQSRQAGFPVAWHMIGHLQRRKVRDLCPHVALVHSVDSLRLAEELDKRVVQSSAPVVCHPQAQLEGASGILPMPVLLEINVSGEEQKHGLRPAEAADAVRAIALWPHLDLRGLMTMAPLVDDAELARPVFRGLRELRDRLNEAAAYPRPLRDLSMGMSQDYRIAVEEGATLVRIGTALFAE